MPGEIIFTENNCRARHRAVAGLISGATAGLLGAHLTSRGEPRRRGGCSAGGRHPGPLSQVLREPHGGTGLAWPDGTTHGDGIAARGSEGSSRLVCEGVFSNLAEVGRKQAIGDAVGGALADAQAAVTNNANDMYGQPLGVAGDGT